VRKIFQDKINALSLNFILVLVEKKIEKLLPFIVQRFNALLYEREGVAEVRVTTARQLAEEEYDVISGRLSAYLHKPVALNKCVDESIIGGIVVEVGDRRLNGSVLKRLREFGNLLKTVNDKAKGAVGAL
jgi:F-type H+-transporting ATPase subunit delta